MLNKTTKRLKARWGEGRRAHALTTALWTKDYSLPNRGSPLHVALLPINYFPISLRSPERLQEKSCFMCSSRETFGVLTWPLRRVLRERCIPLFFFFFSCRSSVQGRVASSQVPWSEVFPSPLLLFLPVTGRPMASRKQNERNVKKFSISLGSHSHLSTSFILGQTVMQHLPY